VDAGVVVDLGGLGTGGPFQQQGPQPEHDPLDPEAMVGGARAGVLAELSEDVLLSAERLGPPGGEQVVLLGARR